ncbi:hypothetical protein RR46_06690 [Papilio xuthus]|uniref:Biogenesis of lysosome-related organelles complex 1 subunit 4 n=1 Tax=Papilio xuthus TaxID=66420 RepID=I4DL96_PAPXU|nr:uncharacterized protein LOC106116862 [Papilio xuthus]KPI94239.1 hypothetical protein RR46_06690 [Papilio xuthus]BAM18686.1 unknown unsecreted protein [Papilio xuthus]
MLEKVAKDYSAYFKLDVADGFQTVQDVIDNMITRLEELNSVVHMIKLKNSDCNTAVTTDINKYRAEITLLSKKIVTLNEVVITLQHNMDKIEKQVEKAESHFGVNNDSKLTSLLRPFLKRNRETPSVSDEIPNFETLSITSVMHNFEDNVS